MAKSTHEKQLERARARRRRERTAQRRATTAVVGVVAVLVVVAVGLGAILVATRDGTADQGTAADGAATDQTDTLADSADEAASSAAVDAADPGDDGVPPCDAPDGAVPRPAEEPYDERPTAELGDAATVTATMTTTCGEIVLALDASAAPSTVENFVALAQDDYYEGVPFHRVVDDFMVQAGDPTGTGTGCVDDECSTRLPGYEFADELGLAEQLVADVGGYPRGTLAMANAGPDTNGSQFFIVQAEPAYPLPAAYTVFGEVVEGMDVVDRIAAGPAEEQLAIDPTVILDVSIERCAPEDC